MYDREALNDYFHEQAPDISPVCASWIMDFLPKQGPITFTYIDAAVRRYFDDKTADRILQRLPGPIRTP